MEHPVSATNVAMEALTNPGWFRRLKRFQFGLQPGVVRHLWDHLPGGPLELEVFHQRIDLCEHLVAVLRVIIDRKSVV